VIRGFDATALRSNDRSRLALEEVRAGTGPASHSTPRTWSTPGANAPDPAGSNTLGGVSPKPSVHHLARWAVHTVGVLPPMQPTPSGGRETSPCLFDLHGVQAD
jgi:hypothetical protein